MGLFRRIKVAQGTQGDEVQPDGLGQNGDVFSEINHLDPSLGARQDQTHSPVKVMSRKNDYFLSLHSQSRNQSQSNLG